MENNLEKEKQNTKVNDETLFIEKDHKVLKWFIVITIILLILGGALTFYYFKIYSNPMLVIGNIINDVKNNFKSSNALTSDIYKISGEIDYEVNYEDQSLQNISEILNNIKLQYVINADETNGYETLDLYTKYEDKGLLNAKVILETKENLGYIYLEDLYDKYLKVSLDEDGTSTDLDINIDYDIIVNSLIEAFDKSINEDDFERDEDKIDVNGNKEKVYRNTLIINNGNYGRIMKTFIKEIQNNKDFVDELSKIDEDININEELNKMLEEIDKETFDDIIKINFYTKRSLKQELLKLEIIHNSEDDDTTISLTPIDGKEIVIDILYGDEVMTIDIKLNGDNNLLIDISLENGNNQAKIKFNISYEELDKIEKINTNSNVNIDNLTKDDLNKIMDNLSKNEALIKLISDISNMFGVDM